MQSVFVIDLVIIGAVVVFAIILLTLLLGAQGRKDTARLKRKTEEDLAAGGRRHDVTV